MLLCCLTLKVGYHTESRYQYQPASFNSAFKLSGTACFGWGRGFPSSDVMKDVTTSLHPLLLLNLSFNTSTGSLGTSH